MTDALATVSPSHVAPGVSYWPLDRVLDLKSGEAALLCTRGVHVAGHPAFCRHGCVLAPNPAGTVRTVLPYKKRSRLWANRKPVLVEDGWLLDGHHRVAYAVRRGETGVWVQTVKGRLPGYQEKYREIVERAVATT